MAIITPRDNKKKELISIENTKFIFRTNFSGDPERDSFGSEARKANIIIPDEVQALDLLDQGFNVKHTKPKPGEEDDFIPTYFVAINVNYDTEWPPKIYLISGDAPPVLLDASTISILDKCYVLNVDVVLNPYRNQRTGKSSFYVRTMYVTQDVEDDPFAHRYFRGE